MVEDNHSKSRKLWVPCNPSWWCENYNNICLHFDCCTYLQIIYSNIHILGLVIKVSKIIRNKILRTNSMAHHNLHKRKTHCTLTDNLMMENSIIMEQNHTADDAIDSKWVINSPIYFTFKNKIKSLVVNFLFLYLFKKSNKSRVHKKTFNGLYL